MGQKDDKEREKTKRTETGKFFYDLSKVTFSITVLTNMAFMFKEGTFNATMIWGAVFGTALSAMFFAIGYRILNK